MIGKEFITLALDHNLFYLLYIEFNHAFASKILLRFIISYACITQCAKDGNLQWAFESILISLFKFTQYKRFLNVYQQ